MPTTDFHINECSLCHSDNLTKGDVCSSCGKYFRLECGECNVTIESPNTIESSHVDSVCESCVTNLYRNCELCGDYIIVYGDFNHHNTICDFCFSDNSSECHRCGAYVLDEFTYVDNYNDTICDTCYNDQPDGRSSFHDYNYVPSPIRFHSIDKEQPLFFGFELECDRRGDVDIFDLIDQIHTLNGNIYEKYVFTKEDGTCDLEIVTQPMTLEFLKKKFYPILKNLRSILLDGGWVSHNARDCGLHVHMSLDQFTDDQLYLMFIFLRDNTNFIYNISQRKLDRLEEWAPISSESNNYLKIMVSGKDVRKYSALRFTGTTAELRIFRGNTRAERIMKAIEFCHAMYMWTSSLDEENCTLPNFLYFLETNKELYNNLYSFLEEKHIIDIPETTEDTEMEDTQALCA